MRMIMGRTLRQAGFDVDVLEAANGLEGLERLDGVDLVLSDWNMPEMNGLEFLQAVRASGSSVPFVFVTTEWTPEAVELARESGADDLLSKPFTAESLADKLRSLK